MKKLISAAAVAAMVLGFAGASSAADIRNLNPGQTCDGAGDWHFVQNQIPLGSGTCSISATWSSGDTCVQASDQVLRTTQHFRCGDKAGQLLSASTNCDGELVLSDYECGEPPKCDDPKGCEPEPPTCDDPKGCEPDPK